MTVFCITAADVAWAFQPITLASKTLPFKKHDRVRLALRIEDDNAGVRFAAAEDDNSGEDLEKRIDAIYDKNMKKLNAPVFESAETYKKTLPTRRFIGKTLTLYKHSFWCEEHELKNAAEHSECNLLYSGEREYIRYLCSPPHSGKTACILPIFLNSAESNRTDNFSYYIYIACTNNNSRNFLRKYSGEMDKPMVEGAAFICKVLEEYLQNTWGACIETEGYDSSKVQDSKEESGEVPYFVDKITELLRDAGVEEGEKVLVHVDEHRKMLLDEKCPQAPDFRKGAMGTLSHVEGVTVVATFTGMLDSANKPGSSGTCRYPLYVPPLNIRRVMNEISEFSVDPYIDATSNDQVKTRLAGLRFRLAFLLTSTLQLSNLFEPRKAKYTKFKDDFSKKVKSLVGSSGKFDNDLTALTDLSDMCVAATKRPGGVDSTNDHVFDLFLGKREDKVEYKDTSSMESLMIVGVPSDTVPLLTCRLEYLISTVPTGDRTRRALYVAGRNRFTKVLFTEEKQLLAASPLEAAYAWALSCRAYVDGLKLGGPSLEIACKRLRGGRLFKTTSKNFFTHPKDLDEHTMYYARENEPGIKRYRSSHPLCDIFFKTEDKELVLIDVTGGGWDMAKKKREKLRKWIIKKKAELVGHGKLTGLHGVVMAPNAQRPESEAESEQIDGNEDLTVATQCGMEGVKHLGGLSQIYKWLDES